MCDKSHRHIHKYDIGGSDIMKIRSIGTKISLIVISMLALFSCVIAFVVVGQMETAIESFAREKAKRDMNMMDKLIAYKHPGNWEIRDGELYKGDQVMNGNFELVDEIGDASGDTVTIFQGDERIATNVLRDGKRAIGTKVSQEVADVVLTRGESFYGEAVVVGVAYQTAYEPIRNGEGNVIGIMYVGVEQTLIDQIVSSFLFRFLIVFLIAMAVSLAIILLPVRRLTKRVGRVSNAIRYAGSGDFTHAVQDGTKDEIGDLTDGYNEMKSSLQRIIGNGLSASEQVGRSTAVLLQIAEETAERSEHIAAVIGDVAKGAESQAVSAQESLTAVEEFALAIGRIAEKSSEVAAASHSSMDQAKLGGESAHRTVSQMASVHQAVLSTDSSIQSLAEKSKEINGMVVFIQNIAQQTNLLALNASIEAARAGEHGRGFSVVSGEVRKLAEEASKSSEHIIGLTQEMEREMHQTLELIAKAASEAQDGLLLTQETERNFNQIIELNGEISGQVEEVAATTEQMSASVEEVAASVNELARIAQTASLSATKVSESTNEQKKAIGQVFSASEALSGTANELQNSMKHFKL